MPVSRRSRLATAGGALLVAAALGPLPAADSGFRLELEQFRLDNGLAVTLHPDRSCGTVHISLYLSVGSRDDPPGRNGMAHLLEHLMFEGSAHVASYDTWLEGMGGSGNAATAEDYTAYWMSVPAAALERALFLEADRLGWLDRGLSAEAITDQKRIIQREREGLQLSPGYPPEALAALFPGRHPYGRPVIGRATELEAATRDEVLRFHREHYRPDRASLVIVGDLDVGRTARAVRRWFSGIPSAATDRRETSTSPPFPEDEVRLTIEGPVPRPVLALHWRSAPALSDDDAALTVLGEVLAGSSTAPLHRDLLASGLAVGISVVQEGFRDAGRFSIEIEAAEGMPLARLREALERALHRVVEEGPAAASVQRASAGLQTDFLTRLDRIGGFGGLADRLNYYQLFTGEADWFERDLDRYRRLSSETVHAAARRWLVAEPVVVQVLPPGREELRLPPVADGKKTR